MAGPDQSEPQSSGGGQAADDRHSPPCARQQSGFQPTITMFMLELVVENIVRYVVAVVVCVTELPLISGQQNIRHPEASVMSYVKFLWSEGEAGQNI